MFGSLVNQSNEERKREDWLITLVYRFDKGFDVSFLAENKRLVMINGDPSWIISSIFKTPKSVEKKLEDKSPLPVHVVIQIRKYPTHLTVFSFLSVSVFLAQVYIERRCASRFDFWLLTKSISMSFFSLILIRCTRLITIAEPSESTDRKKIRYFFFIILI